MKKNLTLLALASLTLASGANAALVFSQSFTGGADSWTMAGGGTMTTQTLTSSSVITDSSLNFLIAVVGGDTDAQSGTISAWVKLPAGTALNLFTVHTNTGTTSSTDISNYTGYSLLKDASGNLSVSQTANSTGTLATAGSDWTLMTLTVSKQSASRLIDVSLYMNGVLWGGGSTPADAVAGSNFNGNAFQSLVLGANGVSVGGLQVYDSVLDQSAVSALYSAQVAAVPEPSTYGLLGAGALAAVAFVRRRKRAA